MPRPDPMPAQPWWKFGYVWMVIAGPAIVVLKYPEQVINEDYYRKGQEINQTLVNPAASLAPAMQGRNHAQTGVVVVPPPTTAAKP